MARTSVFPVLDKFLEGRLSQRLNEWAAEGKSNSQIAQLLNGETGVSVSPETIRRWFRDEVDQQEAS